MLINLEMRAILNLSRPPYSWLNEYFPGLSPYMIPFLSKPLIEFYIDLCHLSKVTDILVVQENFSSDLLNFLSDGSKWGITITNGIGGQSNKLKEILRRNSTFSSKSPFLFFEGFFSHFITKKKLQLTSTLSPFQLAESAYIILQGLLRFLPSRKLNLIPS